MTDGTPRTDTRNDDDADGALAAEALAHLVALTGNPESTFRPDQLDVITSVVADRQRVLLVQRTGWGKSAVYFIATRLLRDRGAGPTLLVSPLLALMRNQIDAAVGMGISARSINSANVDDWDRVIADVEADAVDVLLISPERLANPKFRQTVLPSVTNRGGLLVVDEAHCISDWGHDFRPDYQRIVRVLDLLPEGVPVICCTATANDRVVADVTQQLGSELAPIRGPLARDGLRLQCLPTAHPAWRLAWLAETIPTFDGTGIVYCLTIRDAERVADWLQRQGIEAAAYSGATDPAERETIERRLLDNDLKVVVATSALGMGFDKPDLAFVIHYQAPGSPIAYYQQVGRAGRGLVDSWGILCSGPEDIDIQDHFIRTAFPDPELAQQVVALLEEAPESISKNELMETVNVRPGALDLLLKSLEVDGAIERDRSRWLRTDQPWTFDHERVRSVTGLRRNEQQQMRDYRHTDGCRMDMLRSFLDDPEAAPCGSCDNCTGHSLHREPDPQLVAAAVAFLRGSDFSVEPRRQLPSRGRIDEAVRAEPGRALSVWGDGGWSDLVASGKLTDGAFDAQLAEAAAALVRQWQPDPAPTWVAAVPSLRHPTLVLDLAKSVAAQLELPFVDCLHKTRETTQQKLLANSSQQLANLAQAFAIRGDVPSGPVLLIDDLVDSRWTLTKVAGILRHNGSGPVFPLVLAEATGRQP